MKSQGPLKHAKTAFFLLLLFSSAFAYWLSRNPKPAENQNHDAVASHLEASSNTPTGSPQFQTDDSSTQLADLSREPDKVQSDLENPSIAEESPLPAAVPKTIDSSEPKPEPESEPEITKQAPIPSGDTFFTPAQEADPIPPFLRPETKDNSLEPMDRDPIFIPEFWFWLGAGANYQYYKQTIPSVDGDSSFQNLKAPTIFARAGFQAQHLGLDISFKDTPGEIKSSPSVAVQNGKYQWQTISAEGLYRLDNPVWNLRFGFQHHQMPFMVLDTMTSTVAVTSNTLTLLTFGFDRFYKLSDNLRTEWQMRYQHPVLSGAGDGAKFTVSPKFAFDGSVGGVYNFTKNFRGGVYWYGQWHSYNFSYENPPNVSSGDQTLFYSNIELRLGLEF